MSGVYFILWKSPISVMAGAVTQKGKCYLAQVNRFSLRGCATMKAANFCFKIGMAEETREVRERVTEDLKIAFEIGCARLEVRRTKALEVAIRDWLQKKDFPAGVK